ncbi:hypothetical protein [Dactylosporangium matsuzakiense]|uniref:Uncharacterized protein n=1 Tax=Dactylosporangium matsuzakiense TaxID=53360 RepID=A0A9W6NIG6_9ACTN|nr:hypothetical protein [Dactylosporangium matsuzakiense]UWZ50237.1 hypothetical protein Dmats_01165 [Dactylosporangium matsuzakiense]GLK98839.1 hypothetical protein GCM10017581_005800 [Dactylosporangium matsuzakiense]
MPVTPTVRARQLSLFGVEARPPAPLDLEGLLAAAGQVGRMGGTGRVSIVVDEAWRCQVLRAELEVRGLTVTCEPTGEDGRWQLRTSYSALLAPLAAAWLDDSGGKVSPRTLALDGRRLRLWVAAAGSYEGPRSYLLRLAPRPVTPPEIMEIDQIVFEPLELDEAPVTVPNPPRAPERPNVRQRKSESKITAFDPGPDEYADVEEVFDAGEWVDELPTVELDPVTPEVEPQVAEVEPVALDRQVADNWIAVGDALVAVGLPAVLVGADSGDPAYRIVGPRRISRLAELVGEAPALAPAGVWPA